MERFSLEVENQVPQNCPRIDHDSVPVMRSEFFPGIGMVMGTHNFTAIVDVDNCSFVR